MKAFDLGRKGKNKFGSIFNQLRFQRMCDHGGGGGGIVHSTAQVLFFCSKFFQLKSVPRLLRVSQVVGGSLPQLSTKTLWILFRPCNVALWKGGMFFLERWELFFLEKWDVLFFLLER